MKRLFVLAVVALVVLASSMTADAACSRKLGCKCRERQLQLKQHPLRSAIEHLRADRCCR